MAKSKIIRDLANDDSDVVKALKRLKVLMKGLGDTKINSWINNELAGYQDINDLPEYRITQGNLYGTFIVGTRYNGMQYTDCPLPISPENDSIRDIILSARTTDSISSILHIINSNKIPGVPIPPEYYPLLQKGTGITVLISATTRVDITFFQDIVARVESILIDILCALENEFGVLDSLDIEFPENPEEKNTIIQQLTQYIYFDNSITIGDNNKIKDSDITSS